MDLTANDVREVRFGTTRMRAGYNMAEVDEFLDRIENAVSHYATNNQNLKDEAGALRSQVQQLQARVESLNGELAAAQELSAPAAARSSEHDTVVVDDSSGAVVVLSQTQGSGNDLDSTAETPIVTVGGDDEPAAALRKVRDDLRAMLTEQLAQVERIDIPQ